MKILIAVTHLLGAGHLTRAAVLARAFQDAGHIVRLISGGFPVRHIDLSDLDVAQLPPVRSDGTNFTQLLDENGMPVGAAGLLARQAELTRIARAFAPDVVLTELYPFGRRILADEFLTLIATARISNPGVLVAASIRDILAPPSTSKKAARTTDVITSHYDAILVHSDPAVVPLELSWPVDPSWQHKLHYTGFIAPRHDSHVNCSSANAPDIIVSAGGGSVGRHLYDAALEAARLVPAHRWHLLVGGTDAAAVCAELAQTAPQNLIVEPARPDFRHLLDGAAASVSLCGYNTAIDLLITGVPAVLVPFDADGETEQTLRARRLSTLPAFAILRSSDLSAPALADAVKQVMHAPKRAKSGFDMDGAVATVDIVEQLAKG